MPPLTTPWLWLPRESWQGAVDARGRGRSLSFGEGGAARFTSACEQTQVRAMPPGETSAGGSESKSAYVVMPPGGTPPGGMQLRETRKHMLPVCAGTDAGASDVGVSDHLLLIAWDVRSLWVTSAGAMETEAKVRGVELAVKTRNQRVARPRKKGVSGVMKKQPRRSHLGVRMRPRK